MNSDNFNREQRVVEAQNPLTPAAVTIEGFTANLPTPERALAIGAHPDDVDFGCGATLAKWAGQGCQVHLLVCTDGSKGTWDPRADEEALIATRQREQATAAQALGADGEVTFLGWADGELESGMTQREQVAACIRRVRPNVVLGHDPWKQYRLHPDHRHAGWLTTDGVVAARDPKFFPHLPHPPYRPDAILLFEADRPDHAEDVSAFVEHKYAALTSHHSQFESTMKSGDDPELHRFRQRVEAKLTAAGQAVGLEFAELFKLIDDL
jgi:LmbE family N-acetylglucosaminyl deacetylase